MGEADDEIAEEAVRDEAKRPEADDADEDLVRCHPQARIEYQIATAGIRRDHLAAAPGCKEIANVRAKAVQKDRHRGRKLKKNERLEGRAAKEGAARSLFGAICDTPTMVLISTMKIVV